MKQFISLLISFSLWFTSVSPSFSQTIKRSDFSALGIARLEQKEPLAAVRDQTANPALERRLDLLRREAERAAKVNFARQSLDALLQKTEKAQLENDFYAFYLAVNQTNQLLREYLFSPHIETRLLGAATLSERLRLRLITAQDAQKTYDAFERILQQTSSCAHLQCDFLSVLARGLAHSRSFSPAKKAFFSAGAQEIPSVSQAQLNRQRRLHLLQTLAAGSYGSDDANAKMVSALLPAIAALGSLKEVDQSVLSIVNPSLGWYREAKNKNAYQPANAQTQTAAMDALLYLGPTAQSLLKKYAFHSYSLSSYVQANINLAYTPMTAQEAAQNQANLYTLYCHRDFHLDPAQDLALKQKLAYAYGRGQAPSYITAEGNSSCLVLVPTQPDPNKVAQQWSSFVMGEVAFQFAFFGVGPLISGLKNGARVLKHFKTIQYVAKGRNLSVGAFFLQGGLKTLPTFGLTLAQARAAKEAKALAALTLHATKTHSASAVPSVPAGKVRSSVASPRRSFLPEQWAQHSPVPSKSSKAAWGPSSLNAKEVIYLSKGYQPSVPVLTALPKANPVTKRFPSGMRDEEGIVSRWLNQYEKGYFHPRNQIEAITGMSAQKANNVTEYLYYMPLEEAQKTILNPLIRTGRLPGFMYDARLISGTRRLPAGYYKNKFNANINKLLTLAQEEGSVYTKNVELSDIITGMSDYSFKQGFAFSNDVKMSVGLRKNWKTLVDEVEKKGLRADAKKLNEIWSSPVETGIMQNKMALVGEQYVSVQSPRLVSLQDYFSQTRSSAFFKEGKQPEFFLNSDKWLSWENQRRNLAAKGYINPFETVQKESLLDRVQNTLVLGARKNYLSLDEFGHMMTRPYRANAQFSKQRSLSALLADKGADLADSAPSSLKIKINNFDVTGGACQSAITDGGACFAPRAGYDGTSVIDRFQAAVAENVKAVVFDFKTLSPQVVTIKSVPYVRDLKPVDVDLVRAGTMVADRLEASSDLLRVQQADAALLHIPNLRATIYPKTRLAAQAVPAGLDGGGIGAYLTLYTSEFYPIKTVYRLRFTGLFPKLERQYFIRKEIPALSGAIHRDRLTFLQQVSPRIAP